MRFNSILVIALILAQLGCGLKLNEKAPPPPEIKLDGKKFSCVSQIAAKAEAYVQGQLEEAEITEFAQCLQKAFTTFERYTHGSETDTYRPEEISGFIEDKFLKGKKISKELLHEIMVIKKIFIGGRIDRVSRKDLRSIVSLIEDFRIEALRMRPHIKILNLNLLKNNVPENLSEHLWSAQVALNQTIENLIQKLLRGGDTYEFSNMQQFLTEFRKFTDWNDHFKESKPVENWIAFLKIFKELTSSPGTVGMAADDWAPVLITASRWYMLLLQFDVGVKQLSIFNGPGFENLKYLADEAFSLIAYSIRKQPNLVISYAQLADLYAAIEGIGRLPQGIRVKSLVDVSKVLLNKMLGSKAIPPVRRQEIGLNEFNLSNFQAEFYRWVGIQRNIIAEYSKSPFGHRDEFVVFPESRFDLKDVNTGKIMFAATADWDEFMRIQFLMRPLYRDGDENIFLTYESKLFGYGVTHGFRDLSVANLTRSVMNLFVKGYTNESSPTWDSIFTEEQLQEFYSDVRDFGIDIGFLDSRSHTAGKRSFLEGSLFTYASQGLVLNENNVATMNVISGVQMLNFLHSGGNLSRKIYENLKHKCMVDPKCRWFGKDLTGKEKLSRPWVTRKLSAAITEELTFMPNLRAFLLQLPAEDLDLYAETLLKTAYSPVNSNPDWVEYAEFSTLSVVIHYAEAVMTRYDSNEDGFLDEYEVDAAAPVFAGLIDRVAKSQDMGSLWDWQKVAALKYILAFKEIPKSTWNKAWLAARYWSYWGFGLKVNRLDLAQVFKAIIQKIVEPKMTAPAAPPKPARRTCARC